MQQLSFSTFDQSLGNASLPFGSQLLIGTFDQSLENVGLLKCLLQLILGTFDQSVENTSKSLSDRPPACLAKEHPHTL